MTLSSIIEKIEKDAVMKVEEAIGKRVDLSAGYAARKMFREYKDIFNQTITQYYRYKTKKYSRHYTGVGTGTGVNLFRADQSKLLYSTSASGVEVPSSLEIEINGSSLGRYRSWSKKKNYEPFSADTVVENVWLGIRGNLGRYDDDIYFKSSELGDFYSGRLRTVMETYQRNFKDNFVKLFIKKFFDPSLKMY